MPIIRQRRLRLLPCVLAGRLVVVERSEKEFRRTPSHRGFSTPIAPRVNNSSSPVPQPGGSASADAYLTPHELEALLKVPRKTLAAWRTQRKGPLFHRFGVHVRYPLPELEKWLSERHDEAQKWMAS